MTWSFRQKRCCADGNRESAPRASNIIDNLRDEREQCGADALLAAIDALLNQVEAWEKRAARAEPGADAPWRNPAFMMQSV